MQHKQHKALEAGEDGEQVRHDHGALFKLEAAKNPRGAKHAKLGHCCDGESAAGGDKEARREK